MTEIIAKLTKKHKHMLSVSTFASLFVEGFALKHNN